MNTHIGEGTFSKIFIVAIKKPHIPKDIPDFIIDDFKEDLKNNFEREKKALCNINKHKNIIRYIGFLDEGLILEYISNKTLKLYIHEDSNNITRSQKDKWINQIIEGLLHIHNNGYSHGDINPNNILLDENLNIKLCDFGKSVPINEIPIISTIRYCSPELLCLESKSAIKSDIYSLSIVIWEIITRINPYNDIDNDETLISIIKNGNKLSLNNNNINENDKKFFLESWKLEKEIQNLSYINNYLEKMNN